MCVGCIKRIERRQQTRNGRSKKDENEIEGCLVLRCAYV